MNIRFGLRAVEFPSDRLGELRDSQSLLTEIPALKQCMAEDGYLLLRGLIDRDKVLKARETVLEHMNAQEALTPDTPLLEAVMPQGGKSVAMMGRKHITPCSAKIKI